MITRYDPDSSLPNDPCPLGEYPDGDWVRYSDYEALQKLAQKLIFETDMCFTDISTEGKITQANARKYRLARLNIQQIVTS